jgi:hypothetical protein
MSHISYLVLVSFVRIGPEFDLLPFSCEHTFDVELQLNEFAGFGEKGVGPKMFELPLVAAQC